MKRLLLALMMMISIRGFAQEDEIQQLLLDWEKLVQFKTILQDMKEGYEILEKGYSSVRDITRGNFSLHKGFLDGLLSVNPAVKKYQKVAEIINCEARILAEYRLIVKGFSSDKNLTAEEIEYIKRVARNLLKMSINSLDELTMVITESSLRMSDEERIKAVDRVYGEIFDQYNFLRQFRESGAILSIQRKVSTRENEVSKRLNEK